MASLYDTNIDTLEDLQFVADAANKFNYDRFIYILLNKSVSPSEVLQMRAQILEVTAKLTTEYSKLQNYSLTFNKEFTTEYNTYFSNVYLLLRKVKSGTAQMKRLYRLSTPNNAAAIRQINPSNFRPNIYKRSSLGGGEYMPALFSQEHFHEELNELYYVTAEFMKIMHQCLTLCVDMLREENKIRLNKKSCKGLWDKFKDNQYKKIKSFFNAIQINTTPFLPENNPAIYMRANAKSVEEFAQKGFHFLDVADAAGAATKELIEEAQRGNYSEDEVLIFYHDYNKINRIRYIIQHFDDFLPQNYGPKKLPAKYIACLMLWSVPNEDKKFVKYFTETYISASPKHTVPNNSAVNQQKAKINKKSDDEYKSLIEKWENVEIG